ncbi:unnamed protein product [Acanthoscelides obtectus]|uniref:Uncharacterized protein n=2 Tax=Acanthoscelides obtectus TaxID=200917 RepID=A0A9P0L4Y5_ACAOB|nr:unnamed protein product [Acanthoscelides obtectus]CAK1670517.1 hypothetical protein AOBTE_LOCUS27647 [Acanthoscelides obtectus]
MKNRIRNAIRNIPRAEVQAAVLSTHDKFQEFIERDGQADTKMDVDTDLMFECLIYLNAFYFPVFGICETIMTAAKYNSIVDTPDIVQDAAVAFTKLSAELIKMVIYKRFKNVRRKITTAIVVFFTFVTFAALIYQLFLQKPIMSEGAHSGQPRTLTKHAN